MSGGSDGGEDRGRGSGGGDRGTGTGTGAGAGEEDEEDDGGRKSGEDVEYVVDKDEWHPRARLQALIDAFGCRRSVLSASSFRL
jgi:hypothetical protein